MSVATRSALGAAVVALVLACSGALEGERAAGPVADWSFVENSDDVAFATARGQRFTRVRVDPLVYRGDLYLHAQTIFSEDDPALEAVLAGEPLEMQAAGRIYPLEAVRLTDPADIERILPTLVRDDLHIDATGIRWDPEPARYPGTQVRQWFLRLRSPGDAAKGTSRD